MVLYCNTTLENHFERHLVPFAHSRSIILETNQPVMALGGFSGSDPILTTTQLAALVKSGAVRFFLLNGSGGAGPGGSGQSALITWIKQHSTVVSSSQWQSSSTSSISSGLVALSSCTHSRQCREGRDSQDTLRMGCEKAHSIPIIFTLYQIILGVRRTTRRTSTL